MFAMSTPLLSILGPVKLLALANLAKVASEWANFKETKKREEFSNTVLDWSPRQTPFVCRFQSKTSAGDTRGT